MIDSNPYVARGISFSSTQYEGLKVLAVDTDENRSEIIQRLLSDELARHYGEDWEEIMRDRIERRSGLRKVA